MMMFETSKHVPKTEKRCCVFKVASHPKCDHFGKKIVYNSKIDLTPIFVLKQKFRKKILFLREVMGKIVFSSLITCGAKLLNADWLRQRAFFS